MTTPLSRKQALVRLDQLSARPKRVEVEWIDSASQDGWRNAADVLDLLDYGAAALTCHTVGYLVDEREMCVTVAPSYTVDPRTGLHESYGDPMMIPRVAIIDMRELRR